MRRNLHETAQEQPSVHVSNRGASFRRIQSVALLELPAEVRQIILRQLLWSSHPLESLQNTLAWQARAVRELCPTLSLYPSILRTCRQLHEEGTAILYGENSLSVRCDTFMAPGSGLSSYPFIFWQDWDGNSASIPQRLLSMTSKLTVHVYLDNCDKNTIKKLQQQLRTCVRVIRLLGAWQHLTIKITRRLRIAVSKENWAAAEEKVISPLRCLRIRYANFSGEISATTKDVASLMMSPTSLPDCR